MRNNPGSGIVAKIVDAWRVVIAAIRPAEQVAQTRKYPINAARLQELPKKFAP